MQSVQCTVYSVQCTVYSAQCTVYSVQCTVYSVQSRVEQPGHLLGLVSVLGLLAWVEMCNGITAHCAWTKPVQCAVCCAVCC